MGQENLVALCGNHHDLYHQGHIAAESLRVWKGFQVALYEGLGHQARDLLTFLAIEQRPKTFTADAVLQFAALIAAGLVQTQHGYEVGVVKPEKRWVIELSERGRAVVAAWRAGNEAEFIASGISAQPA